MMTYDDTHTNHDEGNWDRLGHSYDTIILSLIGALLCSRPKLPSCQLSLFYLPWIRFLFGVVVKEMEEFMLLSVVFLCFSTVFHVIFFKPFRHTGSLWIPRPVCELV